MLTKRDVAFSLCDYAQSFIRDYDNPNLDQEVIDAIVVDFINFYAYNQCLIELAMYTMDLRGKERMCKKKISLSEKEELSYSLNHQKEEYVKLGVFQSVNRNRHMNECNGAKGDEREAICLLDAFIKGYCEV